MSSDKDYSINIKNIEDDMTYKIPFHNKEEINHPFVNGK